MSKKKRKVPEINSSSTADIAFLLLIFFLVTTTMAVNKGLSRQLPPMPEEQKEKEDVKVHQRDIFVVLVNSNDQLMVTQGANDPKYIHVNQLKAMTRDFVLNSSNDPKLPERVEQEFEGYGRAVVTKNHLISLQNDRGTSYAAYIQVQNELSAAYDEIRDEAAKAKWGVSYEEMEDEDPRRKIIRQVYPHKISEAEPKNYGGNK